MEALHTPVITADPQRDKENVALAENILDGILPVKLRGTCIHSSVWDDIAMLRGVEPILMDISDCLEFLHKTVDRFVEFELSRMEQMEALDLLDYDIGKLHCTPPYVDDLPGADYDGERIHLNNI